MEEQKILRINELAKKAKTPEGLTEEEKQEQAALRAEYIAGYRRNLEMQLGNIRIVDDYGNHMELKKKKQGEQPEQ